MERKDSCCLRDYSKSESIFPPATCSSYLLPMPSCLCLIGIQELLPSFLTCSVAPPQILAMQLLELCFHRSILEDGGWWVLAPSDCEWHKRAFLRRPSPFFLQCLGSCRSLLL